MQNTTKKGIFLGKIDLIIPTFDAQSTLDRCLCSVAMQTIKDDIKVTIVDDAGSNPDYSEILNRYSPLLDIQLLRYEVNGGPGVARQYGIDHTSNPLMAFIDADDTFASAFSLQRLRDTMFANEKCVALWSSFTEETVEGEFYEHSPAPVWMFGKLYKREFWEKYNIRFHPTARYNEDTGVNSILYLLSNPEESVLYAKALYTYYWHNNKNTITRIDNDSSAYWDDKGFYGFVQNRLWTLANVLKHKSYSTEDSELNTFIIQGFVFMYCYYNSAYNNKSYLLKDIVEGIILYYNRYVKTLLALMTPTQIASFLKQCISTCNPTIYNLSWKDYVAQVDAGTLGGDIDFSVKELDSKDLDPLNFL